MLKFISWIFFIIVALAICALGVANRQNVGFSLDPLPFTFELPLFALLLAAAFTGFVPGSLATWMKGGKTRRENRRNRCEVASLKGQNVKLSRDLEAASAAPQDNTAPSARQLEHHSRGPDPGLLHDASPPPRGDEGQNPSPSITEGSQKATRSGQERSMSKSGLLSGADNILARSPQALASATSGSGPGK